MTNNKIIAIVGMCGSGKSVLADELIKRGWGFVRFGQITIDIIKKRGLEVSEANEKKVREELRREHGMGAFAKLNLPKFDEVLKQKNLAADNMMSWSEYKILRDYYRERLTVVAIFSPPKLRYQRLSARVAKADDVNIRNRILTPEQAKLRDYAEIENIEKGGPIVMADYTILNTRTIEEYQAEIDKFFQMV